MRRFLFFIGYLFVGGCTAFVSSDQQSI